MRTELGYKKWRKIVGDKATYCKENPGMHGEYRLFILEGVANRIGSTADGDLPGMLQTPGSIKLAIK